MLKRHEVQVLRKAKLSQSEVAAIAGISERSVRRVEDEPAVVSVDDAGERQRRGIGRPSKVEAYRQFAVDLLAAEPELMSLEISGLLHQLIGIGSERDLLSHPKCGASWEGYAVEETIKAVRPDEAYFWATHGGAELDLLLFKNGRRLGVECKRLDAPRMTPSMKIALADLRLDRLAVLYPGAKRYPMGDRVEAVPLNVLADGGASIF